ncbi:MAG: hypothetical protein GY913_29665 [Proteobacteria bacterium]|nr:hypothetical protein [Pseudomonadota bacterium]MCP4921084.1 hypothetical protein [Pseudomonadota bacterium]
MILLLACNAASVPPEVSSIRVDPVTEVTSFGAVFLDAQALGEAGQRLPVEVVVTSSSDPEVLRPGTSGSFECLDSGVAELTLQAGHVVKSVPVEVSRLLVERALQIAEGDVAEVPLEPARYRAVVHSDRPVVLRFEGADCTSGLAGTDLTVDCLLTRRGQVEVENPAPNGVGDGDAVAELELVRLPG